MMRLLAVGLPVLSVRGNTDRAWHDRILEDYPRIRSLQKRSVAFQGCSFVGISGTPPLPFRTRLGLVEDKLVRYPYTDQGTAMRAKNHISFLERGLRILELAGEASNPLTLTAIARRMGLNKTTTQRFLKDMGFATP